jgi:nicotinate-nucleotide adenylyltransferase
MIRGLLGGSFDPVHAGHVALAAHVLDHGFADHVVVVPARLSPHKQECAAPAADRLAMVRLAFGDEPRVTVDAREIARPGPSYTVATLRGLAAEHPGDPLRLIVGADNLAGLPRWREPDALMALAELVVLPRAGGPEPRPPAGWAPDRFHVAAGFDAPVSSTAIRAMLAGGDLPADALPAPVAAYIRDHGLYGLTRP